MCNVSMFKLTLEDLTWHAAYNQNISIAETVFQCIRSSACKL